MAESFPFPTYENGIVREAAVDENTVPQNSAELAINMNFDRIGAAMLRPGITLYGSQILAATAVLGLASYQNNAGTTHGALAKVGTSVYANTGSGWAAVRTGLTAASKARFTNFVDYTFMVNGRANEALQTWGGSGNFGTTNAASLPAGDFIENYRSRVWVGDSLTDKLYYSDVVTTSNTVTGGTSFIQISPADGEKMTALKRHPRALLVFKQNHIYRVFSINSTDPDPSIFRGTYSQESVVEAKDGIYYHHSSGFYKFVYDGDQEEISRPITDIIKAIPRSYYESVAGWSDDDHVYWHVGDVTVNGMLISNCVCRRTISTKIWTIYSYPKGFRSAVIHDDGTTLNQLVGDTDGNVLTYNVGLTDNGTPIYYEIMGHWVYFTNNKTQTKSMTRLAVLHENAQGANLSYQLDSDNQKNTNNKWRGDNATIKKDIYDIISINANNFTRMRTRFYGTSVGDPLIFRNLEVVDLVTNGTAITP